MSESEKTDAPPRPRQRGPVPRAVTCGHPDRPHLAGGLCRACYDAQPERLAARLAVTNATNRKRHVPPKPRPCGHCGEIFVPARNRTTRFCGPRCSAAAYAVTPEAREKRRLRVAAWRATPEGKEENRARTAVWLATPDGQAWAARARAWRKTPEGKAYVAAWRKTPVGRALLARRAAQRAEWLTPEGREENRVHAAAWRATPAGREKSGAASRRYYAAHVEERRAAARAYYAAHGKRRRAERDKPES
jgi:hypothetical protein